METTQATATELTQATGPNDGAGKQKKKYESRIPNPTVLSGRGPNEPVFKHELEQFFGYTGRTIDRHVAIGALPEPIKRPGTKRVYWFMNQISEAMKTSKEEVAAA